MYCVRCEGRKKIYKNGGGWSWIDTGGVKMNCPLCCGSGEQPIPDAKKKRVTKKKAVTNDKEKGSEVRSKDESKASDKEAK